MKFIHSNFKVLGFVFSFFSVNILSQQVTYEVVGLFFLRSKKPKKVRFDFITSSLQKLDRHEIKACLNFLTLINQFFFKIVIIFVSQININTVIERKFQSILCMLSPLHVESNSTAIFIIQ